MFKENVFSVICQENMTSRTTKPPILAEQKCGAFPGHTEENISKVLPSHAKANSGHSILLLTRFAPRFASLSSLPLQLAPRGTRVLAQDSYGRAK